MSRPLDRFFLAREARPAKQAKPAKRPTTRKRPVVSSVTRLRALLIGIAVIFSMAAGRAVQVQAIDADTVAAEAASQITVTRDLPAFRGELTDRNGEVLAFTEDTVWVIADPLAIMTNGKLSPDQMTDKDRQVAAAAPQQLAQLLATRLGGSVDGYLPKLTKAGSRYQILVKQVPAAVFRELNQAVSDAGLLGLFKESHPTRRYPNKTLAANVLGFVNEAGDGGGGLELVLNSQLAGKDGKEIYENSPNGKIPLGTNVLQPAVNGLDYQLTIDAGLQWEVQQILGDRVRKTDANSGMAIVMNVKTGEVLALANYPTFDANTPGDADAKDLQNRAVTTPYTPGSVQKALTFAALLDQGLVRADDVVKVPGKIKSGDKYVSDAWDHGTLTLLARGVLAKSSNVGTIELARKSTKQALHDYYVSFGLGQKTGIGLPGESKGVLPPADMPDYSRDGLAFGGSAVSVTLIQQAAAVAGIANGGVYNPPRLLKSRALADGTSENLLTGEPRRVVSEQTSAEVVSMMEAMVQHTRAHTFDIPGYRTGAKTGTSQKLDPKTGKSTGLVTSTIGVGPVEDPQIVAYVVIDHPRRGSSGQSVAGPAYRDIMALALARYGVPQSTGKVPKLPIEP
ncbi:cell division protein FtsI (penicillin-binding protein 3) [Propionicimonas paludicola]|uniref:Cell division protein FtsI (Penicillin-binding protein 3) n=1 Tax=Propionicimonas paludicola TaxID=185243 RepID=A0A2A9CSC4_9ACTN|nr:penicillin-binding protein 2 [Propionicimonas paludicola]PFG16975.1 cell division protein FtsI (penicillin-binding protein 3) [Propionicimonas paludicola]